MPGSLGENNLAIMKFGSMVSEIVSDTSMGSAQHVKGTVGSKGLPTIQVS